MSDPIQTEVKDSNQAAPAGTPAAAGPPLEAQLAASRQEAASNYDRYARAVADLENFRKRTLREKEELRQFAISGLVDDMIPILDNLGLGLSAARQQAEAKPLVDGIALTVEQFKSALTRHGLKELNPSGQRFDPNFHECISHQPSADVAEEHVMQVVRFGYSLNGRLLRPASVVVSSGPAKETAS